VGSASYPYGKTLTQANIEQIVQNAINESPSSPSAQAIYMVFTADDVEQTLGGGEALCSSFLGWHEQGTFTWSPPQDPTPERFTTQYAFIGSEQFCIAHPTISPIGCISGDAGPGPSVWDETSNGSGPPNGQVIDMSITAAMHEAAEAATDPNPGTGVYPEIGDICAWEPGPLSLFGSPGFYVNSDLGGGEPYGSLQYGYAANDQTGSYSYLVQTLWDTNQNACAYGPASLDRTFFRPLPCPECPHPRF
jgi:hypothetical protein